MPDSPDKFVEFGHELLELIHDFFQEKGGIHSSATLPQLSDIFNQTSIPDSPLLIKDVMSEIKSKIIDHSVKVGNPYYIGHMTSAIPYFMILLEMIIAALNQNQVKIESAKAHQHRHSSPFCRLAEWPNNVHARRAIHRWQSGHWPLKKPVPEANAFHKRAVLM